MPGKDTDKPKIAVLENEEPREEPDLDPPEAKDAGKAIKKGAKITTVFGGLFLAVLVCLGIPTIYLLWPEPVVQGGSIAVLPFVLNAEDDSLADKITEDLIVELGKQELLQVTPKAQTFKLKGDERAVGEIGSELGVRYIIQGEISIGTDNDALTVKVNLVNTELGGQIYGDRYQGSLKELPDLEKAIVTDVLTGTKVVLEEEG